MRDPYPIHGRRWTWRHPFSWTCRCGLNAYPCIVERMFQAGQRRKSAGLNVRLEDVRPDGSRENMRHYRWSGGAR